MVCRDDIYKLFAMKDPTKAVQVVKHDYLTVATQKYFGNKMKIILVKTGLALCCGTVVMMQLNV